MRILLGIVLCVLTMPAMADRTIDTHDPNRTATIFVHGFDSDGADMSGVFGEDVEEPLLVTVAGMSGLPANDGSQSLQPSVVTATSYYGDTPPSYYTAQDIAELEAVTKQSYAQLVSARIFEPTGMKASSYEQPEVITPRRARGYEFTGDAYRNARYFDLSIPYAAGSLSSTVDDLLAFDQALYSETLLTQASIAKLFTPVTESYGYGWEVYRKALTPDSEPVRVVGHAGGTFGFHTNLLRAPEHRTMVAVLSNTQPAKVREFSDALMALLHTPHQAARAQ